MVGNVPSWPNPGPRFRNGGCREKLRAARHIICAASLHGRAQNTPNTNAHSMDDGDCDAAIAAAAAAVTHVQSLSQEVDSGDEGLELLVAYQVWDYTARYGDKGWRWSRQS